MYKKGVGEGVWGQIVESCGVRERQPRVTDPP